MTVRCTIRHKVLLFTPLIGHVKEPAIVASDPEGSVVAEMYVGANNVVTTTTILVWIPSVDITRACERQLT